jgi:hypothetical protein
VFQLSTGVANVAKWYPFGFSFTATHYWVGWITIGALLLHIAAHGSAGVGGDALVVEGRGRAMTGGGDAPGGGLNRRGLFSAVGAAVGAITLTQVGGTLEPLKELAVLSPRRPDVGPQSFPVNRTARSADVVAAATSADYRLVVEGRVPEPLELTLADLQSLPQTDAELAIACVEGWSASAVWSGIRVRDLLARPAPTPTGGCRCGPCSRGGTSGTPSWTGPGCRTRCRCCAAPARRAAAPRPRLPGPLSSHRTVPACCRPSG